MIATAGISHSLPFLYTSTVSYITLYKLVIQTVTTRSRTSIHKWQMYQVGLYTSGKTTPLNFTVWGGRKMVLRQVGVIMNTEHGTWFWYKHQISVPFLCLLWHLTLGCISKAKLQMGTILLQFPHSKRKYSISVTQFCSKQYNVVGTAQLWKIRSSTESAHPWRGTYMNMCWYTF